MLIPFAIVAVAGYLLGSLPFGWIVARARGVNIFEVGSRNPGATNVRRTLGAGAGNLVFVLDLLKGSIASGWPLLAMPPGNREAYCVAGLVAAMIGHSFSCFTGFKGGKGVATGAGGFLVLMPQVTLIAAAVWALLFFSIRYVSLASIAAALTIPVGAYFFNEPLVLIAAAAAAAIFVIVRHRANISRLIHGTENRAHPAVGEDS
ncbi:MAG: glycerol-3-phosphate 1-O-acyltransferase PlsY [Opitutaceae bacterium]